MSPEMEALVRRVVATKHWRWMPGMLMQIRYRDHICAPVESGRMEQRINSDRPGDYLFAHKWMGLTEEQHDPLPDLTDPATLGCLLALVRNGYGGHVYTTPRAIHAPGEWDACSWVVHISPWSQITAATEGEALATALLEAP